MRHLLATCLLLLSVSAVAQQKTVLVRLFWQHPPEKIRIEPHGASIRSCASCPTKTLSAPLEISATAAQRSLLTGQARISGSEFSPFTIDGELTITSRDGLLLLTYRMSLDEYVAAVLTGESAGFKSDEALKAMAVAARTYAVHFGSRHKSEGFDFCDTTHCQDVRLGNESNRVREAVAATQGEMLWFEGRPAATYYHRSCGGELEDAKALDPTLRAPYLKQHQDRYCPRADEWHSQIAKADLSRALSTEFQSVAILNRSASGRVQKVLVNSRPMDATDFRLAIGRTLGWEKVRSDLYQLEDRGDLITFRGRGQGHGVGLCQFGADAMGQQGKTYRDILAYYYPGTTLGINAQGLAWQNLSGAILDVLTTSNADATQLLPPAERALDYAKARTGWMLNGRPQIKVFPTIEIYRDATGEPGWIAASTRDNVIRLQPLTKLRQTNALDSTLRHEFLHMIVESNAHPNTPLWLREGLVIYLADPERAKPMPTSTPTLSSRLKSAHTEAELRSAYRECAGAVAEAVRRNGLPTVLGWVKSGVPSEQTVH